MYETRFAREYSMPLNFMVGLPIGVHIQHPAAVLGFCVASRFVFGGQSKENVLHLFALPNGLVSD
jgi:hypothetical protein